MRIGEIAVVSPHAAAKDRFIQAACPGVELNGTDIAVGRLPIDDDLVLHLYGITATGDSESYSWDLLFKKMLGYVMVFDWYAEDGLSNVTALLDLLTSRYDAPLVIAADIHDREPPVSAAFLNGGIPLSKEASFVFCRGSDQKSVRRVLATLINTVLARLE
jgi:signal recognition particle receptor subunit beta